MEKTQVIENKQKIVVTEAMIEAAEECFNAWNPDAYEQIPASRFGDFIGKLYSSISRAMD